MDDDDLLAAWAFQLELEDQEECEHGLHRDGDLLCNACLADMGDYSNAE